MDFYDAWNAKGRFTGAKPVADRPSAASFVNKQEYYQVFNYPHRKVFMPIVARTDWSWQSDTMFYPLNYKLRAVFCCIEMTRRIAFVRVYKGEKPNATECLAFLKELRAKHPIAFLGTDAGIEYTNNLVKNWCKAQDIPLMFYEVGDLTSKGLVESFNKTMRRMLNWYTFNKGTSWIGAVDDIVNAYNRTRHSAIKKPPLEMTDNDVVEYRESARERGQEYIDLLESFAPGQKVRIYFRADPKFDAASQLFSKLGPRWSKTLYVVKGLSGFRVELQGMSKLFSPADLQIVSSVEAPGLVKLSEKARKARGKKALELAEIDAAVPSRELSDLLAVAPRSLRARPERVEPVKKARVALAAKAPKKSDVLAVDIEGHEVRPIQRGFNALYNVWLHTRFANGALEWKPLDFFVLPHVENGKQIVKENGDREYDVLAGPAGAYLKKHLKKIWDRL